MCICFQLRTVMMQFFCVSITRSGLRATYVVFVLRDHAIYIHLNYLLHSA